MQVRLKMIKQIIFRFFKTKNEKLTLYISASYHASEGQREVVHTVLSIGLNIRLNQGPDTLHVQPSLPQAVLFCVVTRLTWD